MNFTIMTLFSKRSVFLLILSVLLMFSCQNEEKTDNSYQEVAIIEEDEIIDESELFDGDFEDNVLTLEAYLDGPDEWFYAFLPEDSEQSEEMDYDVISIIPSAGGSSNELTTDIESYMVAIAENHFRMYEPFNVGYKTVNVFYNRSKTTKMISYQIIDGEADGYCTIYSPKGEVYIERIYKKGQWMSSSKEPFSVDWEFYQSRSNLDIFDTERAMSAEGDREIVSIMHSKNKAEDNDLYKIIQKKSFENPFVINENVFTGTLRAYNHPKEYNEKRLYYELNFTDGWLDGEIKIYDDWGGLELHEIFVMGDLDSTVYQAEYGGDVAKPIIYFYPEKDRVVDVKLNFDGRLTHTYPKYENGWQVYAKTDGTLYDESKQEFYALYWEGQAKNEFTIDEGFVVEGKNTIPFLEQSLATLGLNRKEANEFIIYWLPQMENNPYNLIHFSTTEYEEMAQLNITPKPETLIRVMMVFQPLQSKIAMPLQNLTKIGVERKGFTVVEWGGKKVNNLEL